MTDKVTPIAGAPAVLASKPWYKSRTIIFAAIGLAGGIAKVFGFDIPIEETKGVVDQVLAILDDAAIVVGNSLAIYYRAKASKTLTK